MKPAHSIFRLSKQKFELGDRIIYTSDSGNIPTGSKGFVVGIEGDYVEAFLDYPIMGGSDLEGRCIESRGATISTRLILNLTNIQPPFSHDAVKINSRTKPTKESKLKSDRPTAWNNSPKKVFKDSVRQDERSANKTKKSGDVHYTRDLSSEESLKTPNQDKEIEALLKNVLKIDEPEDQQDAAKNLLALLHGDK